MREHDPDRFLSALFAPAAQRAALFTLYAFNHEIARVGEAVTQPMLGEIRLQWWRETLEQARDGKPRDHDIARALAKLFARADLPDAPFEAMLGARVFDSTPDGFDTLAALETYGDATSGNLMRLAALVLDAEPHDALAREAGIAYALAGVLRAIPFHAARRKLFLPRDLLSAENVTPEDVFAGRVSAGLKAVIGVIAARARDHLKAARALPKPKRALAAFLPAAVVPAYLKIALRPRFDPFRDAADVPLYRRQLAMLRASVRGQV
ncbi:MAG TPA: phytoene/squalene synthase family protein [Rhizomicrobium sp.]|nr:phytoene/squalene synthase family protein [Rhizomicrobium sp.]